MLASDGRLLLERFAFGWQVVDGFSTKSAGSSYNRPHDAGSVTEITAVRRLMLDMQNEIVGPVRVWAGYAIADWGGVDGRVPASRRE